MRGEIFGIFIMNYSAYFIILQRCKEFFFQILFYETCTKCSPPQIKQTIFLSFDLNDVLHSCDSSKNLLFLP